MPTRPLPHPSSLGEAVRAVIDSNRADGYPPTRFVGVTQDGLAPDLCSSWGFNATTVEAACDRSAYFNQLAGHTRYA